MRKTFRIILKSVSLILMLFAASVVATTKSANPELFPPKPGEETIRIFIVSHGYHSGVILPVSALTRANSQFGLTATGSVLQRFAGYEALEIGWGDANFYRYAPYLSDVSVSMATKALFASDNKSVLHIVGLNESPRYTFPNSEILQVDLSTRGFFQMARFLDSAFLTSPDGSVRDAGAGLYGPSRFFEGRETFGIWNVCNHFVSKLLGEAGLSTSYVAATLPAGMFADLKWRTGLAGVPR